MEKVLGWVKVHWHLFAAVGIGLVVGFLLLALARFIWTQPVPETHYHANFQVFINGKRELFDGPGYYEEVTACVGVAEGVNDPKARAHMHDNVNDVAHVHDLRVTWQDFFTNIGWAIGPDYVRSTDTLYPNTADKQVTYILNGQKVSRVDDKVIGDQDKLLVSYDAIGTDFMAQYNKIQNNAKHYDESADPATCSGLKGHAEHSFSARLKRSFFGS